jgi:hypothetical protein
MRVAQWTVTDKGIDTWVKKRCVMGNVSPDGNMQAGVCVGEKLHLKRFMIFSLDFFYHF